MGECLSQTRDRIQAVLNQAKANIDNNRLDEAESQYRWVLNYLPNDPQLRLTLGLLLLEQGRFEPAITELEYATRLDQHNPHTFRGLGDALAAAHNSVAAIEAYEKACALDPANTDVLLNLGNAYQAADRFDRALSTYQQVLALCPDDSRALNNIGKTYHDMGILERAMDFYKLALQQRPDYAEAHFNRSIARITLGDYSRGWPEYEWRFKRKNAKQVYPHHLLSPRWQGQKYDGRRLLVHCEQGYGDALQFARFLPMVKQFGGSLIVEAHPPLMPLLQDLTCVDQVVAFNAHQPPTVRHDFHVPMLSLPYILGITDKSIPTTFPYLRPNRSRLERWHRSLTTRGLRIGFVWASSTVNPKRNFPIERSMDWLKIPGITFYSLQKGPASNQTQNLGTGPAIKDMGSQLMDFGDTAALIANLDLVISVDTAVAHLSAALGKPLWILLPHASDWRWPSHLLRSPWYPSAKIFRQTDNGNWDRAAAQVFNELDTLRRQAAAAKRPTEKTRPMQVPTIGRHAEPEIPNQPGLRKKIVRPDSRQCSSSLNPTSLMPHRPILAVRPRIKKVLLVSPIYGGSLEVVRYLAAGFEKSGFTTRLLDNSSHYAFYRQLNQSTDDTRKKELKINQMLAALNQRLMDCAAQFKPDLLLAIAQSPIDNQTVRALRKNGTICAYWFVEDYRFREYWSQIATAYDHFFMIQRDSHLRSKFQQMGYANWHYLPLACEPAVHKPWSAAGEAQQAYACQIGFMGAPYLNRLKIFDQLTDFDLKIWGEGWCDQELSPALESCVQEGNRRISPEESVKIYSSAQILVNLHSSPFDEGISPAGDFVNPRTFEVAACGGFQLTDYRCELPELFEPGKEIVVFHDLQELKTLIKYWLTNDRLRTEMSKRARQRGYAQHTYQHRADEMVRLIEEN